MSSGHRPLTRTPAPSLDFSRPGTPAASDFGDIYFSTDGGLEETRAVFLQGCGLPGRWMNREVFTIAELGFGSGLNFLATWQSWQESGATGRLHFISVEGYPFDREQLSQALSAFPELSEFSARLIESWPGPVRGVHRRHFGPVSLTLIHDDIAPALAGQDFAADAWFLDGFSPAKNPDMWSEAVLSDVARLSAPGARIGTFTVAGAVRRGLEGAGFEVERLPGFGRKRQRLEARMPGAPKPRAALPAPTIIGAGIAGASVARAFLRRGIVPTVLHDPDHIAASGNGAALIKPRLDKQDNPASRFFLSSFLYAREAYRSATRHEGVSHLPKSEVESARLQAIAQNAPLGPGHLDWTGAHLDMPSSLVIDTEDARQTMLDGARMEALKVAALDALEGPLIIASGYGIRALMPELALRWSRGQLSWGSGELAGPVTYGGYAIPLRGPILLGATHDRLEDGEDPFALSIEDDARNLEAARAQGLKVDSVTPYRASVRVNTADTLPRILGPLLLHRGETRVVTGLGSRGFVFAPLLGEALVCDMLGEPVPLERTMWERLTRDV